MNKNRVEYENLIRNSILFSLDRETQTTAYRREALKMVEYLYLYLTSINADKYSECGLEITETANRCIKNYSSNAGDFLNYFNAAIAKEYRKAYARRQLAEHNAGVHIPERDQRVIRKYIKFAECQGSYELCDETIDAIAISAGVPHERVIECISDYNSSFSISDTYTAENGYNRSLFELIASGDSTSDKLEEIDGATDFLMHINEVYCSRQTRQKPLLSKLLTAKIAFRLMESQTIFRFARKLDFFDEVLYTEFCKREDPISAREIAKAFGISEQSASRTYKAFMSLL